MIRHGPERDRPVYLPHFFAAEPSFLAWNPQKSSIPAAAAANRRRPFVHIFPILPCQRAARMQGGGTGGAGGGRFEACQAMS